MEPKLICILRLSPQKIVPSSEEVMLDQVFVNDEQAFLKRERELFTEYEGKIDTLLIEVGFCLM